MLPNIGINAGAKAIAKIARFGRKTTGLQGRAVHIFLIGHDYNLSCFYKIGNA